MNWSIFPARASTIAGEIDALYGFELIVAGTMTVLIFFCVFFFAIRYRRRRPDERPKPIYGSVALEITWSAIPFLVMLVMFGWGAKLYVESYTPPRDALDIYVVGRQWMWKVQHPGGQSEINELHVPIGTPVRLTLASQDVIHSFFIPAFRIKHDVVPGQYQTMWFQATQTGRFHLFCAEYCGTDHSGMGGWITAMTPADYENWLSGGGKNGTMTEFGERLFTQFGCASCHLMGAQGRCPTLQYVYGHPVELEGGATVMADENYIRESILNPNAKIVRGYHPDVMPVFQGQISEEQLMQLLAYVKSLGGTNIRSPKQQ